MISESKNLNIMQRSKSIYRNLLCIKSFILQSLAKFCKIRKNSLKFLIFMETFKVRSPELLINEYGL